jgi:hypothetical protein
MKNLSHLARRQKRSGPARTAIGKSSEGLGLLFLRPPGPKQAQKVVRRSSQIDDHT